MNSHLPKDVENILGYIDYVRNKLYGAMAILDPGSNHIATFLLTINSNLESLSDLIKRDIYDPESKNYSKVSE